MAPRYASFTCLGAFLLVASCRSGDAASPLALYPGSPEGHAALLHATLEMDGRCLYLAGDGGERWLAAFPSPGTSWDPESRSVQMGDEVVRVGATGRFGGGETKGGPGGIPWVQAPGAECDSTKIWLVNSLDEP